MNYEKMDLEEKRERALHLFTREKLPSPQVCKELNIEEAQFRQWKVEGDWDTLRRTLLISREHQLKQLYELLEKLNDKMAATEELNAKDVELAVKYTTAIRNLDVEVGIPEIVEVAKMFTSWLQGKDKELTKTVTAQFDAFIKKKLRPYAA